MALVESQEVSLKISTETSGTSDVAALADRVEALAREGGSAAPQFAALAAEIRLLGQQQVRIDGLQESIGAAKSAYAAVRDARHEVQVLDKALGDARGAGANREAIQLLEKELKEANRELATAERAWTSQKKALSAARAEATGLGVDVKNLGQAQQQLATQLDAATAKFAAQAESVKKAREAEQARAQEARDQAREEDRLAAIVSASKAKMAQAAQELLAAEKRTYAEATAAAKRYDEQTRSIAAGVDNAFSKIGIRSAKSIQTDILGIEQGLQRLAADARVSGAEFDRAWTAGQKQIGALKAEMSGALDPFTASISKAGDGVDGLMTRLRPLAGAIAAAFSIQQGIDALIQANVQAERLGRSLATIATPAFAAREQLKWLRDLADRNGIAFDHMAQSFTAFAASTRGTALEGQKTRDIFDAIVTSMGRMGRSSDEVGRALVAVSQMAGKGTVSMEELRGQLSEAMPGAMQALARGLGLTTEQLTKMVGEGRLLAVDALPALQRELKKTIDATSDERVAGFEAGWNRLRNAIERALDAGQAKRDSTGNFLDKLAAGVDKLTERSGSLENSWDAMRRAIETGNWSAYSESVDAYANAIEAAKDQSGLAAEQHRILGNAAAKASAEVDQSIPAWTSLDNAYLQILTHVRAQIDLAERNAATKQAEGSAAVALAQAIGNEVDVRYAAFSAARDNADALANVAQQRLAEVETLKNQLASLRENMAATHDESKEHREALIELQNKITARQSDADRAVAQAGASRLAAEAARDEAEAQADNSHRVGELRDAYAKASETLNEVAVARRLNQASAEELTVAELAAVRAASAYRDALKDEAAAIQANLGVKQAQSNLDQTNVQLSIAVAQRAYEVAKAKGDEKEATEALLRIKRLEADLAELQAKALQAQASAELLAVKNKLEQAQASGTLTEQLKAELKAEQLSAEAKVLQGKISEETAGKLRELASQAERAGTGVEGSMRGAASATKQVGDAAADAAKSFWEMSDAAKSAETEAQRLSRWDAELNASRGSREVGGKDGFAEALKRGLVTPDMEASFRDAFDAALTQSLGNIRAGSTFQYTKAVNAAFESALLDASKAAKSQADKESTGGSTHTTRYEVRIHLGSIDRTIEVASQNDAQALTDLLKQLETAASRAA